MRHHADVAYTYKINPFTLTRNEVLGMAMNIPRIEAKEIAKGIDISRTDPQDVYDIWMLAYEDELLADRMRVAATKALVDSKIAEGRQ